MLDRTLLIFLNLLERWIDWKNLLVEMDEGFMVLMSQVLLISWFWKEKNLQYQKRFVLLMMMDVKLALFHFWLEQL
jgi:hypothetical protein